jgi:hypothetical protein
MQATSVQLCAEREAAGNTGRVFCHQAQDRPAGRGFLLGLTSPFMLSQATLHGHGRAVLVDATHAMNSYNVCLSRTTRGSYQSERAARLPSTACDDCTCMSKRLRRR